MKMGAGCMMILIDSTHIHYYAVFEISKLVNKIQQGRAAAAAVVGSTANKSY
jgi:hypothetical protein